MPWSWFDLAWPWIGAAFAAILLILLFATRLLQSAPALSRWRDPAWLSWLAVLLYLLHNIEEYGIDLLGVRHAFPDALCTNLGQPPYPGCTIPPAFYLAVNLSLIWVAGPIAALLSRRHPLVGFVFYGVIGVNGMTHLAPALILRSYNPGLVTGVLLFLPLTIWIARTQFGPARLPYKGFAAIMATGALVHVVLAGSVLLFLHGALSGNTLAAIQLLNAALFLAVPFVAERRLSLTR
jgi:hypothetical protein